MTLNPQAVVARPTTAHAVQVTEDNVEAIIEWLAPESAYVTERLLEPRPGLDVVEWAVSGIQFEGKAHAAVGDWIVKYPTGSGAFRILSPEAYARQYAEIPAPSAQGE